ncbi:hypothetical protein ABW18_00085 [Gordonia jacobaea]|uniref:DUF222 domain-containing protein n=2 Tax=Gordoniaceae TaxID=85026 RepID=A0ABR5IHW5_9ACTN|nr:hypothetical protein ABW18_00085 [Gordonia jacobaea]
MTPHLAALGLLSDDEQAQVKERLAATHLAEKTSRELDHDARRVAQQIAAELPDNLTAEHIRDAALRVPDQTAVDRIVAHVWVKALDEAAAVAFAHKADLAATLNRELEQIVADFAKLSPKLGGVHTADEAINANKVGEWRRAIELDERYRWLRSVTDSAQIRGLLPEPSPSDSGPWWRFRIPDTDETVALADGTRVGNLAAELARQPYVPATTAEAQATADAWEHA